MKAHAAWGALVLVLLIAFALYWRNQGAQAEREHHIEDSLSTANARIAAAAESILARHGADSAREAGALRQVGVQQVALNAANGRAEALARILRDSIGGAQQARLDSLEALHAQQDSLLMAQRDGYKALFLQAAASRDTLAVLLRASQAEANGLQVALVQARKTPLLNKPIVKLATLGLAFALGKWGR